MCISQHFGNFLSTELFDLGDSFLKLVGHLNYKFINPTAWRTQCPDIHGNLANRLLGKDGGKIRKKVIKDEVYVLYILMVATIVNIYHS